MNQKLLWALSMTAVLAGTGCTTTGTSLSGALSAGQNLVTAATLSDADVKVLGDRTSAQQDKKNKVAAPGSKHAKRLATLTSGWKTVDGITLDYKVYMTKDINAFAVPNGAIRIFSGLMDKMTDDEVRYVVAHEIGHVVLGHSRKALQVAYATSAAREAAAASGNSTAAAISNSELGVLGEALVNAQFSQKQENEADDFALEQLRKAGKNANGAVTALRKLEKMFGNDRSVFSSHPAPGERAARMEQKLASR